MSNKSMLTDDLISTTLNEISFQELKYILTGEELNNLCFMVVKTGTLAVNSVKNCAICARPPAYTSEEISWAFVPHLVMHGSPVCHQVFEAVTCSILLKLRKNLNVLHSLPLVENHKLTFRDVQHVPGSVWQSLTEPYKATLRDGDWVLTYTPPLPQLPPLTSSSPPPSLSQHPSLKPPVKKRKLLSQESYVSVSYNRPPCGRV
ncbi:protein ORF62 [Lake sturgeon herpesvirus]|nr:protein ORF62 [Lake sturgeon herpesvirus]